MSAHVAQSPIPSAAVDNILGRKRSINETITSTPTEKRLTKKNKPLRKKEKASKLIKPVHYQWVITDPKTGKIMEKCPPYLNYNLELYFRKLIATHKFSAVDINDELNIESGEVKYNRNNNKPHQLELTTKPPRITENFNLDRYLIVAGKTISPPRQWEETQTHTCQLFEVAPSSDEFNMVANHITNYLPAATVTSVQRIQNLLLYQKYVIEKKHVLSTNGLKFNSPNELFPEVESLLLHGTRKTAPAYIISSQEGFDVRLSATQNLWGTGSYFAKDATYTHAFSYRSTKEPHLHQVILASVLLGTSYDYGKMCNTGLREAPAALPVHNKSARPDESLLYRYDSVVGETKGTQVFAVYRSSKAYPQYLIKYELEESFKVDDVEFIDTSQIEQTYKYDPNFIKLGLSDQKI